MPPEPVCYGAALRRASRVVTRLYERHLAPCGLNFTQFSLAGKLARGGAATIIDLARWMDTDPTAMGRNLAPLERDGCIVITTAETDRRCRRVSLTAEGRRRYRLGIPLWRAAQAEIEARLDPGQAAALHTLLLALADGPRAPEIR